MLQRLINDNNVLCIYEYGSKVYKTQNKLSDEDYIIIVNEEYTIPDVVENTIEFENNHYCFYSLSTWVEMCRTNNIVSLECLNLPKQHVLKEDVRINVTIDKIELRKSISKVASNSYDKCRKKLTIEKDFAPRIAKKSLWHSMRILMFGIQCYKYGKIVDYTEANDYYDDIVNNTSNEWLYYKNKYHNKLLALRSELRELSQPEWDEYKGGNK